MCRVVNVKGKAPKLLCCIQSKCIHSEYVNARDPQFTHKESALWIVIGPRTNATASGVDRS